MKGLIAFVALEGAAYSFDKLYSYAVPTDLHNKSLEGCRVTVPFGRGNLKKQGMVIKTDSGELKGLKNIVSVVDSTPSLSKEMLLLCEYMHDTLFCTYYDAVSVMIPKGLGFKLTEYYSANEEFSACLLKGDTESALYSFLLKNGEKEGTALKGKFGVEDSLLYDLCERQALVKTLDFKRRMGDATQKWVKLSPEFEEMRLTDKQSSVVKLLRDIGAASVKEICYFTGVTSAVVDGLVRKGILVAFNKKVYRNAIVKNIQKSDKPITLTEEQSAAYCGLKAEYLSGKGETALLYGVTGSGKTQVFLKLVEDAVNEGRGVIVMVPEIALTPQLISLFVSRLGNKVAVFHSALSVGQRMDEWQRIKDGKALVAIGTRSAVFAPFSDLGLIIMDEEQEHTYKSEKSPRYTTKEIARFRTRYHKGLLCLASATPSLESFTMAKSGKYSLFEIKNRYGNAYLPYVKTVDMKKELAEGNTGVFSRALVEAVSDAVADKKQAIVLLNRRGYNTYISCPSCGEVAVCPNCSISLTYHSVNNRLMCHYCGYSEPVGGACKACGYEHMKFTGVGTQKAQDELEGLFPKARVLRLDADSTASKDSYSEYLTDFANGKYDIMLGTQMVAKGLDFPNVTVVGVVGADAAAYSEDYRSFERAFSLLTQVVGRAGRGTAPGVAIIQTQNPDSELIGLAESQDYDSFYEQEILTRKLMIYPPYCDICTVTCSADSSDAAKATAGEILKNIKRLTEEEYKSVKVIILGPTPALVVKVNNRYRYKLMIKCRNNSEFRSMLKKAIDIKYELSASASVDFNPETVV